MESEEKKLGGGVWGEREGKLSSEKPHSFFSLCFLLFDVYLFIIIIVFNPTLFKPDYFHSYLLAFHVRVH